MDYCWCGSPSCCGAPDRYYFILETLSNRQAGVSAGHDEQHSAATEGKRGSCAERSLSILSINECESLGNT